MPNHTTQNIIALIKDLGYDSATLAEAIGLKESSVIQGLKASTPTPRWGTVMLITAEPLQREILVLKARITILEEQLREANCS